MRDTTNLNTKKYQKERKTMNRKAEKDVRKGYESPRTCHMRVATGMLLGGSVPEETTEKIEIGTGTSAIAITDFQEEQITVIDFGTQDFAY